MRLSIFHVLALLPLFACSYADSGAFDDDEAGPTGGSSVTQSGQSSGGGPVPISCTDGKKNATESDVDCGGACPTHCGVGQACASLVDCTEGTCQGGLCKPPSGTDGIKNGDESDLDCGGAQTGAELCAVGKACNTHADCASGGCKYDQTCADAPSCAVHLGGDTCGAGDVGSGQEQHESCCTSVDVQGFTDSEHPGQQVAVDRYEVTAGRVREFVRRMAEENGGQPNVKAWLNAHKPVHWDDSWTDLMAEDNESEDGIYRQFSSFGDDNQGAHIHGMNCNQRSGSYGFSTYWYPADILMTYAAGAPRAFSQDELDVKSMNCITNAMLAAFCAWDGGQLATAEVLDEIAQNLPQGAGLQITSDSGGAGGQGYVYYGPHDGTNADDAARVAPPGRVEADRTDAAGGSFWMDLAGNMNEMAFAGSQFSLKFGGIGMSSARALSNPTVIPQPNYKAAESGGRCMRFR